jgi:hypothetical protein
MAPSIGRAASPRLPAPSYPALSPASARNTHVQRPPCSRCPCSVRPRTSVASVVRLHPTESTVGSLLPLCGGGDRQPGGGGRGLRKEGWKGGVASPWENPRPAADDQAGGCPARPATHRDCARVRVA